ncbi:MAG TPA: type II secretion system F family protein [Terriglobales bacterium]|nr:type II secretion system F family protein [Terriglobales bacterium]
MAEFLIRMADERGRVLEQVENGPSQEDVRERFSQQGFLVYWVKPRGILAGGGLRLHRRRKVKLDEFVIFNAQFLTLIKAGLPILTSLDLLLKRQKSPVFRAVLENVRDRVRSGELLSDAFLAQGIFPKIYTTTLLAGEKSGNLEEVLTRYIAFQRVASAVRKKLLASLVYPALLIGGVILILTVLLNFVIPKFQALFADFGADLPKITVFTLTVGTAVRNYFFIIFPAIFAALFVMWRWSGSESGAQRLDRIRLSLPLVGSIWLKYQVGMFSRMLSTLLAGGIPLMPALQTAADSMQSRLISNATMAAADKVREGSPLSRSLEEAKVFPVLAVEMIEVGESTGALPAMLNSVADFYEEDVQTALVAALSLIEPLILIVMGVIVAFVLISLYLPIFSLGAGGIRPA